MRVFWRRERKIEKICQRKKGGKKERKIGEWNFSWVCRVIAFASWVNLNASEVQNLSGDSILNVSIESWIWSRENKTCHSLGKLLVVYFLFAIFLQSFTNNIKFYSKVTFKVFTKHNRKLFHNPYLRIIVTNSKNNPQYLNFNSLVMKISKYKYLTNLYHWTFWSQLMRFLILILYVFSKTIR